jgi:putative transposase
MSTIATSHTSDNTPFRTVAEPFLQQAGLPFAKVLSAEVIEQAFAARDALFGQQPDEVFSTPLVLWAFLAQMLRDGKEAACASAVAHIATYMRQTGGNVPCGDTGDYCRARAKLDPSALRSLVRRCGRELERQAKEEWLWHGRHAKLVDGFTFTMADTPDNQEAFPQQDSQAPGVGFPIARACVVLSLATGAVHDLAFGPYEGKQTGETALLRTILDCVQAGDVVVFDRCYCSYMMIAILQGRGIDVCVRLHQRRPVDFRCGTSLGDCDHLVTWPRPRREDWQTPQEYEKIPPTLTLRELEYHVPDPGCRAETITVITTMTDPAVYPKQDVADLFGDRWFVELDIRDIKQTLRLDHLRCKTPEMVLRELWVKLLAYNLIRKVIATAAAVHHRQPRQIGFTLACQTILSSWMLLATGACPDPHALWRSALKRIAANKVGNRPGRVEPRVLKQRRHRYPLMTRSRQELKQELCRA